MRLKAGAGGGMTPGWIAVWSRRRLLACHHFSLPFPGTLSLGRATSVRQVMRDRQEVDPTEPDVGCSRFLLSSGCDHY